MAYQEIPDSVRDRAVELYQSGARVKAITEETGIDRPTLYWILRSRGIRPSRAQAAGPEITTDVLLERLLASEREVGRLQERVNELEGRTGDGP